MTKEDRIDIRVIMCTILRPKMVELGIIPENHKWQDTTEEQAEKIKEFINKELERYKEEQYNGLH